MELVNRLPFPAMAFRQFDSDGDLDCVVAMRGTFMHDEGGSLVPAQDQEDFQWEDAYDGDPHTAPMVRQSDLTPEKPGTDVTFLGNAVAPDGKPVPTWDVSIEVGPLRKVLKLYGNRLWEPVVKDAWAGFSARQPNKVLKDWRLTEPDVATSVPLCWSKAYGGAVPGTGDPGTETPADVEPYNPLGCGIVNLEASADMAAVPAPQITAVDAASDWRERAEPHGFGPIPPWWRFRQQYAGTYDDTWLNERHPLLPSDFDPGFWQCAHPDLIAIPHLEGAEGYRLENLHPSRAVCEGKLPALTFGVHCVGGDRDEWHVLNLDGVHFDWRSDQRVLLTWRIRFPLPKAGDTTLTLTRVQINRAANDARETA